MKASTTGVSLPSFSSPAPARLTLSPGGAVFGRRMSGAITASEIAAPAPMATLQSEIAPIAPPTTGPIA